MAKVKIKDMIQFIKLRYDAKGWNMSDRDFLFDLDRLGIEVVKYDSTNVQVYFEKNISPKTLFVLLKKMTNYQTDNPLSKISFADNKLTMPLGFWGFNISDMKSISNMTNMDVSVEKRGVDDLKKMGFTIYTSSLSTLDKQNGIVNTLYEFEKDGIEFDIVKYRDGDYYIKSNDPKIKRDRFSEISKKPYKTLKSAAAAAWKILKK